MLVNWKNMKKLMISKKTLNMFIWVCLRMGYTTIPPNSHFKGKKRMINMPINFGISSQRNLYQSDLIHPIYANLEVATAQSLPFASPACPRAPGMITSGPAVPAR